MAVKKLLALVLTVCMALVALPAFAGDRPLDPKRDLSGISPKRHRYIFTVLGGAALGEAKPVSPGDLGYHERCFRGCCDSDVEG